MRLVQLPEEREPPPECLAALRDLTPRAEMVYAGNGLWWLGVVVDDTPAVEEGWKLVAMARGREREGKDVRVATWRKALLMTQGFRMLGTVGAHNGGADPMPSACVDALAPALYSTHKEDDAAGDQAARVSDGSVRREASDRLMAGDFMQYHARDVYRTARRRSVTVDGRKPEAAR